MTAQPIDRRTSGYDPDQIFGRLPASERAQFLQEYHSALDAAHEIWRYKQLQDFLHLWHLRAIAMSDPTYYQCKEDAERHDESKFVDFNEAMQGLLNRP
jgi:hypothetical protein